ncbi:MAG: MotA/TolQ/ExbB proton channel family protein [candidate division KSB1 bacterium]|nr:MotA/TolQ/ExbB proton channel family protein [candidate division KSB1 bacterium]
MTNRKSALWRLRLRLVYVIFFVILQLFFFATTFATSSNMRTLTMPGARADAGIAARAAFDQFTLWQIFEMCGWLFWPFAILTAAGLILLIYRALAEYQQKMRAYDLLVEPIDLATLAPFIKYLNLNQPCRAARLFNQMIATFNKTKRAESLQEDANYFVRGERESFEAFNRVISFLADTAIALGLLGTLWGIFATFHRSPINGEAMLRDMSIALVTTFVGLVISIALNLGVTWLHAFFSRQLKLLGVRAEELRQTMLHLQVKSSNGASDRSPQPSEPVRRPRPSNGYRHQSEASSTGVEEEYEEWA